jgi:ribosomal subunit interface protein
MEKPVQLSWHHIRPSPAVASRVEAKAAQLERYYERITGCSVTLEAPSHHHRQSGPKYRVRVELTVPGARLVVGRDPKKTRAHGDLLAAVNAAFLEARRQLQDHVQRIDQRVKAHRPASRAVVTQIFPGEGYGFLRTPDGRDVYFHEHSVLKEGFDRLRVGTAVRYAEEAGDEGPQASTVAPLRAPAERR